MFEILTVCTGNICRSPLAELLLTQQLAGLPGRVHSAGTYDLGARQMTTDAQRLATREGVSPDAAAAHRSRALTEGLLRSPDLILVMTRDHRRQVLEMAPVRMRSTFTIREFARLAAEATDAEISAAAAEAGDDPSDRLRAACDVVASYRGMAPAPGHAEDDDVIDPYRRSWDTYELTASQLLPAVRQAARVARVATDRFATQT